MIRWFFILALSLLWGGTATAANHYIRVGGSGTFSGNDWNNACNGFTGACGTKVTDSPGMVRGDTYYVGGSATSYGNLIWSRPNSGTSMITIKKATVADHGTGDANGVNGWLDTLGTTQAIFGTVQGGSDYWAFDGSTRNENDWSQGSAYGFHASNFMFCHLNAGSGFCNAIDMTSNHVTLKYVDVGGAEGAICHYGPNTCDAGLGDSAFRFEDFSDSNPMTDFTISRYRAHNVFIICQCLANDGNNSGTLFEYGWNGPNQIKEAFRGGNGPHISNKITIRYNKFMNACLGDPRTGQNAGDCTASIAVWSGPAQDHWQVYGNLFWEGVGFPGAASTGTFYSDGMLCWGSACTGNAEPGCSNCVVANNTFANIGHTPGKETRIGFGTGATNSIIQNNIWFNGTADIGLTVTQGCYNSGPSCLTNLLKANANLFVNPVTTYPGTGLNYHLAQATSAGTPLTNAVVNGILQTYDTDMDGNKYNASGTWMVGAFALGGGPPPDTTPPAAPTNLRIQ